MRIPNRKMVSLLMLSLSLSLSGAEKLLDWNSTRPDDYGKCRLSKKGALTITKEGAQFNGQDSFLHLGTPKIAESLTIALQVKLTGLPEKQYTFAVRRGFTIRSAATIRDGSRWRSGGRTKRRESSSAHSRNLFRGSFTTSFPCLTGPIIRTS